jgi:hypothetical protein
MSWIEFLLPFIQKLFDECPQSERRQARLTRIISRGGPLMRSGLHRCCEQAGCPEKFAEYYDDILATPRSEIALILETRFGIAV